MNTLQKHVARNIPALIGICIAAIVSVTYAPVASADHGGGSRDDDTKSEFYLRDVGGSWRGTGCSCGGSFNGGTMTIDWDHVLDFAWTGQRTCALVNFTAPGESTGNGRLYNRGNDYLAPGERKVFGQRCRHRSTSYSYMTAVKRTPPVSATLEVRSTNNSSWQNVSSISIEHDETLDLAWSSSNATSCTGTNMTTGGNVSGTDTAVTLPSIGASRVYRVSCTGLGTTVSDQVVVTRLHPAAQTDLKIRTTSNPTWQPAAGTVDINHDETVDLTWSSTNATACTGTNVNTAGQIAGTETDVSLPSSGSTRTYTVTCSGLGADTSRQVTINRLPVPPTNLGVSGFTVTTSTGFDRATGAYDSVIITGTVNNSGADTTVTAEYEVALPTLSVTDVGVIPTLALGATHAAAGTFSNIAFGPLDVILRADTTNVIAESDETDNELSDVVVIPPPAPNMILTTPQPVISDSTATIEWDTDVSYPMDCTVRGVGVDLTDPSVDFDPSVDGSTGSIVATGITSGGLYELRCVEPTSGTEFIERLTIEVVGNVQEI